MAERLILFILIFGFMSCNKDDDNPVPDIYTGTASATKNGEEWNSLISFDESNLFLNTFTLGAAVYNSENLLREIFDIRRIQANFEVQEITSTDNQNELGLLSAG